jgi:integrase
VLDQRGRLLVAALGFAGLRSAPSHPAVRVLRSWLDSWAGIGRALQEILGHATLTMTMRYAHLAPEHLRSEITKTEKKEEPGTRRVEPTKVSVEDQREVHISSMLE